MTEAAVRYRKPDIKRLAGISERQYNYWIEAGFLGRARQMENPGSGYPRALWTDAELQRFIEIREAFERSQQVLAEAGLR